MNTFNSIEELARFVLENEGDEWVYVNIKEWNQHPRQTTFWLIEESYFDDLPDEEVYESEYGPLLPVSLEEKDLRPWITQDNLLGVLQNINMNNIENVNIDVFIRAINYYRNFDDFMDL